MTRDALINLINQMKEDGYEKEAKYYEELLKEYEKVKSGNIKPLTFNEYVAKIKEELGTLSYSERMIQLILAENNEYLERSYKLYGEAEYDGIPQNVALVLDFEYLQEEHYEEGIELYNAGNYEEAFHIFYKECYPHFDIETESTYYIADAQYYLGTMYIKGDYVECDYKKGFRNLIDAFEGGVVGDFSVIFENIVAISESETGKKYCKEYIEAVLDKEYHSIDDTIISRLNEIIGLLN
jgi:hypothetical protein